MFEGDIGDTWATLSPADFAPEATADGDCLRVLCDGVCSGLPYLLPAGGGGLGWKAPGAGAGIEQTAVGAVAAGASEQALDRAAADIVRRDMLERWWRRPRNNVALVTRRLEEALPGATLDALVEAGLTVAAYRWDVYGLAVVMVVLHTGRGAEASFGSAADVLTDRAVELAFLDAVRARSRAVEFMESLPDREVPDPGEGLRLLAAWLTGPEQVSLLDAHCRPSDYEQMDPHPTGQGWVEVATRRFGHEPIAVRLPAASAARATKLVCPGAAVYAGAHARSLCLPAE